MLIFMLSIYSSICKVLIIYTSPLAISFQPGQYVQAFRNLLLAAVLIIAASKEEVGIYCVGEMGSLMAGWDSPVLGDDNKVRARRNRSLTREEVEAFWKQQRKSEDGEISSPLGSPGGVESPFGSLERRTSPLARGMRIDRATRVEVFPDDDAAAAGESPSKSRDWWTRSNWAFLNEPPQEEVSGKAQNYTPQFHVARIATGNA